MKNFNSILTLNLLEFYKRILCMNAINIENTNKLIQEIENTDWFYSGSEKNDQLFSRMKINQFVVLKTDQLRYSIYYFESFDYPKRYWKNSFSVLNGCIVDGKNEFNSFETYLDSLGMDGSDGLNVQNLSNFNNAPPGQLQKVVFAAAPIRPKTPSQNDLLGASPK